jgi:hypothetical protein
MLIGVLNYYESLYKNNFMLSSFTGSSLGEDSMKSFYDFYLKSRKKGYQVKILNNIKDINKVDLFIFINYPNIKNNIPKYALTTSKPKFLLNYECPTIYPETWRKKNFKFFDKIFTWDDSLIDNKKFFKTNCPSYYSPRLERFDLKKNKNNKKKVYCFIGDMTAETGIMHESLKYARNYSLPIHFVIEDNSLSVCTNTKKVWKKKYSKIKQDKFLSYYKYNNKYPHAGAGKRVQF